LLCFASDPGDKDDNLEARAYDAEQSLIRTLDALAERRRQLRTVMTRARETLKSGALAVSLMVAVGATRLFGRRGRRRGSVFGTLFLLGASVGLLTLVLRPRADAEDGG
jgi:hypothetical protein